MKKLNNKGFTLIELLAVIVILGVVMLIAIPYVSKIIANSKENTFISSAQTLISGARNMVLSTSTGDPSQISDFHAGTVTIGETTHSAYAIKISDINLESGSHDKSSFGTYNKDYCFVVAVAKSDNTGYDYYIQLLDDTKHGIPLAEGAESNLSSPNMKVDPNATADGTNYLKYDTAFPGNKS